MINIYQAVTEQFLSDLDKGIVPWQKPWSVGEGQDWAYSHNTGKPYSFLNYYFCYFEPGEYMTFQRAKMEGGHVKKGAKSRVIFVPTPITKKVIDENGEEKKQVIPHFKPFFVFHISETEGVKPTVYKPAKLYEGIEPVEAAEKVIDDYLKRSGVKFQSDSDSDSAYYDLTDDTIACPRKERFPSASDYYKTTFHELAHSTGIQTRLGRYSTDDKSAHDMKSESYSLEELVAELTSVHILRKLGLETPSTWQNSVSYVGNWNKRISSDKKFVVIAASRAEKAANMILGIEETNV